MRRATQSVGVLAVVMVVSACTSPSSVGSAVTSGSVVVVSSPATGSASSAWVSSPVAVPPVGSRVAATPEPGVTVTCPDIVHGDPGAIGWVGDISTQQAPSQSAVFRAVVRCEMVTRTYPGHGPWQVELAEVAYGNPTALITQLRAASQPPDGACGMASQYEYPWFVLVEANGQTVRPAVPRQGCGPLPSAVDALNQLPFNVVDAVRIQAEATS